MTREKLFSRRGVLWAFAITAVVCPLLISCFDRQATVWASQHAYLQTPAFKFITQFGDALYPIVLTLLLLLIARTPWGRGRHVVARWLTRNKSNIKFLLFNVVASGLLTDLLKMIFGRSRPKLLFATDDYGFHFLQFSAARWSFPSGHCTTAIAIALTLLVVNRKWGCLALVPALLVCFSRFALLQHYPSDIFAAAFVALLTTTLLKEKLFFNASTQH